MGSFGGMLPNICSDMDSGLNAGKLARAFSAFPATTSCSDIYDLFHNSDAQPAAAVVDREMRVVGIVSRLHFLEQYAHRYIPELYGRRPVMELANRNPLTVDEKTPLAEVVSLIVSGHAAALRECFVVTRGGKYLGIGTGEGLIRNEVALLARREVQLKAAVAAAEDAIRTKSNFLALMSHELRTPLNAIIGFSEVLAGEMFGPHSVDRYGVYARDILSAGRSLLELINGILDLSRSESRSLDLYPEPLDVYALLQNCVRSLSVRAGERQVRVTAKAPDDLPFLLADAERIRQVVLALLSNGIKFTSGGGKVELSAFVDDGGGIAICVADTGIGMEPETIPIALEPFRQLESPLARHSEGSGLGLSLAKSLTEQHGGNLEIDSAPGVGTKVHLRFPRERTIHEAEDAKTA